MSLEKRLILSVLAGILSHVLSMYDENSFQSALLKFHLGLGSICT